MEYISCLRSFIVLANSHNFAGASSILQISTSKLSKQMSWLENYFGKKIFVRSTRHLILSDFGKLLYPQALEIIKNTDHLKKLDVNHKVVPTHIHLIISTTPIVPYLTRLNLAFMRDNPQISLTTILGRDNATLTETTNLSISFEHNTQPYFYTGKLISVQRGVFASPKYLTTHKKIKKIEDLLEHNCLVNTLYGLQNRWIFGDHVIQVQGNFNSNSASVLRQAALNHFGLIWVPPFTIAKDIETKKLVRVLEDEISPAFNIYYSYSRYIDSIATVKELIQFYQQRFEIDIKQL